MCSQLERSTEGVRSVRASETSGKGLQVAIATARRGNALVGWGDLLLRSVVWIMWVCERTVGSKGSVKV